MKRVIALALASMMAVMAFALAGCSAGPTPTDVTKGALDALKAQDAPGMRAYFADGGEGMDIDSIAQGFAGSGDESATADEKALREKFLQVMCDFDYELGDEAIDGDTATVEATITSHDLSKVLGDAMGDYLSQAFAMAFDGASEDEMSALFEQIFVSKLDPEAEKTHVASTTFHLSKVDGEWKLDKLSEDNLDCLLGGLMGAINSLNSSLNGTAGKAS